MKRTKYVLCKKDLIMEPSKNIAFRRGTVYKIRYEDGYGIVDRTEIGENQQHAIDIPRYGNFFPEYFEFVKLKV